MERAYAQALWNIVSSGTEAKKAVHALHTQLVAQGREGLLPRIAREFARLAERRTAQDTVTLTIADKAEAQTALKDAHALLKKLNVAEEDAKILTDDSLIGGWRLEGREMLADESHKKHLLAIYAAATS